MKRMRTGAIIPAAGLSTRMDGFKPLLRIGKQTLLERVIELFQRCGVEEIVTVVGFRAADIIPVAEAARSRWVINNRYRNGMFSSVQAGVEELRGCCRFFFLLPVDMPLVRPATIHRLLAACENRQRSTRIWYPQFGLKRGHPPLISEELSEAILAYQGQDGMRGFLRGYEHEAEVVSVSDPFIRTDVDTPEDLELLRKEVPCVPQNPQLRPRMQLEALPDHNEDSPPSLHSSSADLSVRSTD